MADTHRLTTVGMPRHTTATDIDQSTPWDIGAFIIDLLTPTTADRVTISDGTAITGGTGTTGEYHAGSSFLTNDWLPLPVTARTVTGLLVVLSRRLTDNHPGEVPRCSKRSELIVMPIVAMPIVVFSAMGAVMLSCMHTVVRIVM